MLMARTINPNINITVAMVIWKSNVDVNIKTPPETNLWRCCSKFCAK
jgi:hypothetical protein